MEDYTAVMIGLTETVVVHVRAERHRDVPDLAAATLVDSGFARDDCFDADGRCSLEAVVFAGDRYDQAGHKHIDRRFVAKS